ncbi:MAG: hypothetical protein H7A25_23405 [Leptospiraceae bacterium]|nr:hypothetical protein [Leptospiraceae bacterium]MCP5502867.1 hypothetical protein [Leptospiraceae bacterium]
MAKFKNNNFFQPHGKIGSYVYYQLNGDLVARGTAEIKKKPSEKQLQVRRKFSYISKLASILSPVFRFSAFSFGQNRCSRFSRLNNDILEPGRELKLEELIFSDKQISVIKGLRIRRTNRRFHFIWNTSNCQFENIQVLAFAFFEDKNEIYFQECRFEEGKCRVNLPDYPDEKVKTFIYAYRK